MSKSSISLPQRIFAGVIAGVFIISACAFSVFVILDMQQARKDSEQQQSAQSQEGQQAAGASVGKPLENFTPVESVGSLEKNDIKEGDGAEAKPGDSVTVDYTGAVAATGEIFQSSKDTGQPATLSLDSVIEGWKEGIPGMKEGGSRRLVIPASMAYGSNPPQGSGIPADAALVFDVTLVKVEAATDQPQGQ